MVDFFEVHATIHWTCMLWFYFITVLFVPCVRVWTSHLSPGLFQRTDWRNRRPGVTEYTVGTVAASPAHALDFIADFELSTPFARRLLKYGRALPFVVFLLCSFFAMVTFFW